MDSAILFRFVTVVGRHGGGGAAVARRLEAEDAVPSDELPAVASGRIDRAAALAVFPTYQQAVEAEPGDWRAWYRLALAYDASGDRRRARWATRTAIRLERDAR